VANDENTFSFQEALNELHLEEDELKRLVSEGEIRAFRDGDNMRLRREDIDSLRSELGGEIVFEEDDFADAGMATEEITEADTLIDDIEDIDDIEAIEEVEDEEQLEEAVPVMAAIEEEPESMGLRAAMIATSLVLFLALPIFIALATGNAGGIARGIAGMFFPEVKG